ncbi:MAG: PH domain-containing protein [Gammaproteobacteria bacterium]|nr:PH domain-containing protein [Gammaproteobacteria bacterium]
MFENAEIPVEGLPSAETVAWQPMDPKLMRRRLAEAGIALSIVTAGIAGLQVLLGIALVDENVPINLGFLWLVPLAVGIAVVGWPLVCVPKMAYAVRERDILYRSGVFWHTVTAVPYNRIQHVEKSTTPLDRRFQLANLKLFTAGGAGGDLTIRGLPVRTAEKLRAYILDRTGTAVEQA